MIGILLTALLFLEGHGCFVSTKGIERENLYFNGAPPETTRGVSQTILDPVKQFWISFVGFLKHVLEMDTHQAPTGVPPCPVLFFDPNCQPQEPTGKLHSAWEDPVAHLAAP